jgi:hypothetical protein
VYPARAVLPPDAGEYRLEGHRSTVHRFGAEVSERERSRMAVVLFGEVRVFHRPHPSPHTDKGAAASVRKWLEQHGVVP